MRSTFRLISPPDTASELDRALSELRGQRLSGLEAWRAMTALLMCGDFEAVRAALTDAPVHAALPLVAARYHGWSGDLKTVMATFERVRSSLPLLEEADAELQSATWPELERVATDVGDPVLASRMARRAREQPTTAAAHDDDAAADVIRLLDDLIGPEPDAHRGRLRLRPQLGKRDDIRALDLRFGDGAVSLTARRQDSRLEYSVAQEAGAMPFTLLLEPRVDGPVAAVMVDGQAARLDIRPIERGFIVPVQLVLDAERSLSIELEATK